MGDRTLQNGLSGGLAALTLSCLWIWQADPLLAQIVPDNTVGSHSLSLSNSAQIVTSTIGQGNAGNIRVKVSESVSVNSRSSLSAFTASSKNAGNITIEAEKGTVSFDGESGASTSVFVFRGFVGTGQGGNLTIKANRLSVTDNARLFSDTFSIGNAGDVNLSIRQLLVRDGATISTTATPGSEGDGGTLTVNATESVRLVGTSADGKSISVLSSATSGKGRAGDINLTTRQLQVRDGAAISTTASPGSEGNGGTLTVNATESVQLIGTSADGQSSSSLTSATSGKGRAGDINLTTRQLQVQDGAAISAATAGGRGGTITVNADRIETRNGGRLLTTTSGDRNAGDIILQVENSILLTGNDSGLFINASSIVAVPDENSDITANAFLGDGGRIVINTQSIFGIDFRQQLTPLNDITASSQAGTPGVVIINTSGIEPTRGLENLTEERINVEVAQGCQVGATARGRVSFYNVGRGGLPPSPDDFLNSPVTQEWLSLELQRNTSSQPKVEPSFSQQHENTAASKLIFSCQAR